MVFDVRAAAALTNAYVEGTVLSPFNGSPARRSQLVILADFTIGSLTDCQIKVEFSSDGSTYYQETFSSISGGTDTLSAGVRKLTASGKYRIAIPIKDSYIKISAIGTGTVGGSSLAIKAAVGTL